MNPPDHAPDPTNDSPQHQLPGDTPATRQHSHASTDAPLQGVHVVNLAPNLPGPAAAARLHELGATVTKVEPPSGDLMADASADYYNELARGQHRLTLDLKSPSDRERLDELLDPADILLTAHRPSALNRLGLDWPNLHARHPRLIHVCIVGDSADPDHPGHDLTFQAAAGTLTPPTMPRVLLADLAAAERAATAALAALVQRDRTGVGTRVQVAIRDAAEVFAAPARHGLTAPHGLLGGAMTQYRLYQAADGWVALAAIEDHFWQRFCTALDILGTPDEVAAVMRTHSCAFWQEFAATHDIPLAICEPG